MLVGVKKMQTFEQYWALVHATLDHRDILRAAEQAWAAGFEAGFEAACVRIDFDKQLYKEFNDEHS